MVYFYKSPENSASIVFDILKFLPLRCTVSTEEGEMHLSFLVNAPWLLWLGIFVIGFLLGCFVNQFVADQRLHKLTHVHWKLWREEEQRRQRTADEIAYMREALWYQDKREREDRPAEVPSDDETTGPRGKKALSR
jgi:hypothetical protein